MYAEGPIFQGFPSIARTVADALERARTALLVPLAGIEPALLAELDFESSASTNSATGAFGHRPKGPVSRSGRNIAAGLPRSTRADVIVACLDSAASAGYHQFAGDSRDILCHRESVASAPFRQSRAIIRAGGRADPSRDPGGRLVLPLGARHRALSALPRTALPPLSGV